MSKPTAKQIAELKDAAKEVLLATADTAAYAHSMNRLRAALEAIEKPAARRDPEHRAKAIRHPRGRRL